MNYRTIGSIAVACLLGVSLSALAAPEGEEEAPKLYVPYRDLAAVIDEGAKAVLMDRTGFQKLLEQARANSRGADSQPLAQVTDAQYQAIVTGQNLALKGRLKVVSLSDSPVAVPLGFGHMGLLDVTLDGKPAPLGYDAGVLVLLAAGKGEHEVVVSASAVLAEVPLAKFPAGGLQLGIAIPPAVAGTMTLSAPGDLDIATTAAATKARYDRATDRTSVDLTIGGRDAVTAVLLGNGRQEAARPILVGESTTSVDVSKNDQTLHCLFTVDVLGRSVRELEFSLDKGWTITGVSCPDLVRWSVGAGDEEGRQTLTVRLRSACRGLQALRIKATSVALVRGEWRSPRISLREAAFQRGYLLVNADSDLRLRGQELLDARREDVRSARTPEAFGLLTGRLYYHWGPLWSVKLQTAGVALRRESQDRQNLAVTDKSLTLAGQFQVTAVGAEMFDLSLAMPPAQARWELVGVTVNGRADGFEYHIADAPEGAGASGRILRIELARPVAPEALADVRVTLQHVPEGWAWPAGAPARQVAIPMLRCLADAVSGVVSVTTAGDLDAAPVAASEALKPVNVGRMTAMGLTGQVQLAYTYDRDPTGVATLSISRRKASLAAESVALVSVRPEGLEAKWVIRYAVTRAGTTELSLLADASLGEQITIGVPGRRIASRQRTPLVVEGSNPSPSPRYDLWKITLDAQAEGTVPVEVEYTRPMPAGAFALPLVRPYGADQVSEVLAVQASEELAVDAAAVDARWVDSADLALPAGASRVLAAWQFDRGGSPVVTLTTTIHKPMAIPPALAASANLTTYLEPSGDQRTEAAFTLVNAGLQFLSIHLDERASLWSISINGQQAKPQRDPQGNHMIPLPRTDRNCAVRVVYAAHSPSTDPITLVAATLPGVKVNLVTWRVWTGSGYFVSGQDSHMMGEVIRPQSPAYRQLGRAISDIPKASALAFDDQCDARIMGDANQMAPPSPVMVSQSKELSAARDDKVGWGNSSGDYDRSVGAAKAGGRSARPASSPPPADKPQEPVAPGIAEPEKLTVTGRYTLPVELVGAGWQGRQIAFNALDQGDLRVSLGQESELGRWELLGFVVAGIAGLLCIRRKAAAKARLILTVLVTTSLVATWWPAMTASMNGMFYAGLVLAGLYLVTGLVRWLAARAGRMGKLTPTTLAALLAVAMSWSSARGEAPKQAPAPGAPAALVVPYEGDPTKAAQADKILVPYSRYVELWNRAHPDQAITPPPAGSRVWLADVRYAAGIEGDKFRLALSCQVETLGQGYVVVPMPLEGLAVVAASLNEAPVVVSAGPGGIVLTLPGGQKGTLRLTAVTTPKTVAGRPTVAMTLPPLPAGVMTVKLPGDDLLLEAPEAEGALTSAKVADGTDWTVPLGLARRLTLRWSPKALGGTLDRTLSAQADHEVVFQHWGLVGETKLTYTFSATDYDQFRLLVPAGLKLTSVSGANLRDYAVTGTATVQGQAHDVVLVRLHRSAAKSYAISARWAGALPALEAPFQLALPQAGDVGRESGTVNLHVAGGMTLTEIAADGGRRRAGADLGDDKGDLPADKGDLPADSSKPVASYYWPYRPFALKLSLHRGQAEVSARLQQLVRLDGRRCQLLVQADLEARRGRIFEAAFALPEGFEVLSAVGGAVDDHYIDATPAGRRLYVNLRAGVTNTRLALVLVRTGAAGGAVAMPRVTALDADGAPLTRQSGRLAVQLAGSLQGHTVASENLQSVPPPTLSDWLDADDVQAVQFAYEYQRPATSLTLEVSPRPTRTGAEIVAGLSVAPTSAWYTYRLRYTISGSPIDQVSFTLPQELAPLVAVTSAAMRSVKVDDAEGARKRWTVSLVNEVTGVLDVAVNFALPIGPKTDSLALPRLLTDAPEGCRTVLAVQNLSRHELSAEASGDLTAVPVSQQQALLGGLPPSLQYVFQSFATDWSLALRLKQAKEALRVTAIVDLMTVTTAIDKEGNGRYMVELLLQNRSKQYLRMKVPSPLTVWSVYVDGQAVKPVRSADPAYGADEVLIPLIKTSATGLPYTVKTYLAGRVCGPLGLAAKISPPAVRLVDIDVVRSVWTLRLPTGFCYAYPGGTMDEARTEILGRAYQLESNLRALTSQVERYSSLGDERVALRQGNAAIAKNWNVLNARQAAVREELNDYISRNRIEGDELRKFQQAIASNEEQQHGLLGAWGRRQNGGQSINTGINGMNVNGGLAEADRDKALRRTTDFVAAANRAQQEAIAADLGRGGKADRAGLFGGLGYVAPGSGKDTTRGRISERRADEEKALKELTSELEKDSRNQLAQQQADLSHKLSELKDNRYVRGFGEIGKGKALGASGPSNKVGGMEAYGGDGRGGVSDDPPMGSAGGGDSFGDEVATGQGGMGYGSVPPASVAPAEPPPASPAGEGKPEGGEAAGLAIPGGQAAMGTFSLPIDLPDIGVRKDFTSPGGEGTVTIWAIQDAPIAAARSTTGILTGLLLLQCCLWAVRHVRKNAQPARAGRRGLGYALLAASGWVVWGMTAGVVVALLVAAGTEAARFLSRSPTT